MNKHFGLDFGTTNSSIAIEENGRGKVLAIDQIAADPRVVRSLLYFLRRELVISSQVPEKRLNAKVFKKGEISWEGEQEVLVGQEAINQYISENKFRHPGIIRKILTGKMIMPASASTDQGRVDPIPEYYEDVDYGTGRFIQSLKTALKSPYYKGTSIFGEQYSLEKLIASFIQELLKGAQGLTGEMITKVVCGRPVYFLGDSEKDALVEKRLSEALTLSGFSDIQFELEPIAAAKQFTASLDKEERIILVFDFGGGTLDTALVKSGANFEVLAADGVYIGGDLLNADILRAKLWGYFGAYTSWGDYSLEMPHALYEALGAWYTIPSLNNPDVIATFQRLKYQNSNPVALDRFLHLIKANLGFDLYSAIELAKKELSFASSAQIVFANGPIDINVTITKEEFEEAIKERVEEVREVVLRTLERANVQAEEVDIVVRTGGSSLIPIFEKMLVDIFGKEKIKQFETFTSIAAGLAL